MDKNLRSSQQRTRTPEIESSDGDLARDISELKQKQDTLENLVSLIRATVEATADGILVVDQNENITAFNQVFLDLWRIQREDIESRGYPWALSFVLNQLSHPDQCLQRIEEITSHPELESHDILIFKDGRIFERYSRPQRMGNEVVGRVFSYRDITARKKAEEQSNQYSARLKALSDVSRSFAEARLDLNAVLDAVVRSAAELFNDGCIVRLFSEDQSQLRTKAFYHTNSEIHKIMKQFLPQANSFIDEASTNELLKTGRAVLVSLTAEQARLRIRQEYQSVLEKVPVHCWIIVPLRVAGRITGTITVFRLKPKPAYSMDDQSFLQELADRASLSIDNAQLYAESQKAIQMREDFMSIASHELKTPLTPLKMQLQLLAQFLQTGIVAANHKAQELQKLIANSDQQIIRLTRLVEDMLDASRLRTGQFTLTPEPVDLVKLVAEIIERFQTELASAKCVVQFQSPTSVRGFWDKLRIDQVITNLLSNAMKYGAGKPIQIIVSIQDHNAVFSIQDFGIGIAKEDQSRLFERFGRVASINRFGGLGMGLYIARQIIEGHCGHISLNSAQNEGSTFQVELPLESSRPDSMSHLRESK